MTHPSYWTQALDVLLFVWNSAEALIFFTLHFYTSMGKDVGIAFPGLR